MHTFCPSTQETTVGRSGSLKPAWSTGRVPEQLGPTKRNLVSKKQTKSVVRIQKVAKSYQVYLILSFGKLIRNGKLRLDKGSSSSTPTLPCPLVKAKRPWLAAQPC